MSQFEDDCTGTQPDPVHADALTLDVGGRVFRTTKSTLCAYECSFFQNLLGGAFREARHSHLFIDRDGEVFAHVLQFLRSGHVLVSNLQMLQALASEADFLGCYPLQRAAEARIDEIELHSGRHRNCKLQTSGLYALREGASTEALAFLPNGELLYSRGLHAENNVAALLLARSSSGFRSGSKQGMPRIWKDDSTAADRVAGFMTRHIRRGTYSVEGNCVVVRRGKLVGEGEVSRAPMTVLDSQAGVDTLIGVLMGRDLAISSKSGGFRRYSFERIDYEGENGPLPTLHEPSPHPPGTQPFDSSQTAADFC